MEHLKLFIGIILLYFSIYLVTTVDQSNSTEAILIKGASIIALFIIAVYLLLPLIKKYSDLD